MERKGRFEMYVGEVCWRRGVFGFGGDVGIGRWGSEIDMSVGSAGVARRSQRLRVDESGCGAVILKMVRLEVFSVRRLCLV